MELDGFLRQDMEKYLAKYEPEQDTDVRYEDISAIRNVDYPKRIQRLLKNGRFQEAKRIYAELKKRFVQIPVAHQEERRAYYKILLDSYKRIYDYVADQHKTQRILSQIENQADVFDSSVKPQIQDNSPRPARPTVEEAMKGAPDPAAHAAPINDPAVNDISFPVVNVTPSAPPPQPAPQPAPAPPPKQPEKPTFIPSQDNHIVAIPENPDKIEDAHTKETLEKEFDLQDQIEQDFAQQVADDYASKQRKASSAQKKAAPKPAPPPEPAPKPVPASKPAAKKAAPKKTKKKAKRERKPAPPPLSHSLKNILKPEEPAFTPVEPAHDDPEPKKEEHGLVKLKSDHVLKRAAQELIAQAQKLYSTHQYEQAQRKLLEARFEARRANAEHELLGHIQEMETLIGQQLVAQPQKGRTEVFSTSYLKGLQAMQLGDWRAAQHYFMARVHEAPNDRAALIRLHQCNEVLDGRGY